jgi:hypothetical protein
MKLHLTIISDWYNASSRVFYLFDHWLDSSETGKRNKNAVFWNVTPRGSCNNRRFGGTWRLHHQGDKNRWTRNVIPMMKALSSSETSVLIRATRCNIPEDGILRSHCRENLKSYTDKRKVNLASQDSCYLLYTPNYARPIENAFFWIIRKGNMWTSLETGIYRATHTYFGDCLTLTSCFTYSSDLKGTRHIPPKCRLKLCQNCSQAPLWEPTIPH